jgi:hypothetical protein
MVDTPHEAVLVSPHASMPARIGAVLIRPYFIAGITMAAFALYLTSGGGARVIIAVTVAAFVAGWSAAWSP